MVKTTWLPPVNNVLYVLFLELRAKMRVAFLLVLVCSRSSSRFGHEVNIFVFHGNILILLLDVLTAVKFIYLLDVYNMYSHMP